jgi:hypothetical protein
LADQLAEVSKIVEKISNIHGQLSGTYESLSENPLAGIHKALQESSIKLLPITKHFEEKIRDRVIEFMGGKEDELDSLHILSKQWQSSKTQAMLLKNKLLEKKNYLFDKRLIDQWEIGPECKHTIKSLLNHREAALLEMLPKETKEAERHKEIYSYYSNKLQEEFKRIAARNFNLALSKIKSGIYDTNIHLDKVLY